MQHHMTALDQTPIERLARRTALRLRLMRALDQMASTSMISMVTLLVGLYYLKTDVVAWSDMWLFFLLAGLWALAGFVWGATKPISPLQAAARLDKACGLHDALSSALLFSKNLEQAPAEQRPFMEAEIRRALQVLPKARPALAAPWRWPRDTAALAVLFVTLVGFSFLRIPRPRAKAMLPPPKAPEEPKLQVDKALLREYRDEVEQLKQQVEKLGDKRLEELLERQKRLIADLEKGRITRSEFLKRYDKLMKAYGKRSEKLAENLDRFEDALAKLGQKLARRAITKKLGNALMNRDMDEASRQLRKLAHKLDSGTMRPKEKRELRKALKEASRAMKRDKNLARLHKDMEKQGQRLDQDIQAAREEIRRLEQLHRKAATEQQKQAAARKLQRRKRRLNRLEKQRRRLDQQKRSLQRLQRQMNRTGSQKTDAKTAAEMRKLIKELQKYQHQASRGRASNQARMSLKDLRELLKRLRQQRPGRKGRIQDFFRRARGGGRMSGPGGRRGRPGGRNGRPGGKGQGRPGGVTITPGGSRPGGLTRGQQGNKSGSKPGGDKAGTTPGGNPMGRPSALDGDTSEHQVSGKESEGPSADSVVRGAASKGFTSTSYRKLLIRYRRLQKQVLDEEDIPPGYRYYVRRYYKLIRARK